MMNQWAFIHEQEGYEATRIVILVIDQKQDAVDHTCGYEPTH